MIETYVTFALYLVFMIFVGVYFFFKSKSVSDYLLGGRAVGSWVTALSAQASDMSGWLLMGLPGAVYLAGLGEAWIAIGLGVGTLLNWLIVAPRLRVYTEKTNSMTLAAFFSLRFRDPTGYMRVFSAIITLFFFTIYAASGLNATGNLFEEMFKIPYQYAVVIGAAVLLIYTFLGGYLAVCWTDLFQGILMFAALILVPICAINYAGGCESVSTAMQAKGLTYSLLPKADNITLAVLAIFSASAWGLGYFGQPHILVRFMSIKSPKLLPRTITIAMVWVIFSLIAAVVIGFVAMPLFQNLDNKTCEKVFIYMVRDPKIFNPWIGGILLAAILAAIMSTIDSQLLVSSTTLTEDFYKFIHSDASPKVLMRMSRIFVIIITIIASGLALMRTETIFSLVKFAWGGFGAAFGPVVIMSLYSRKTSWQSAFAGMIMGTAIMLLWYVLGFGKYMYEIVPGFFSGLITISIMNKFFPQKNECILKDFDEVANWKNSAADSKES